MKRGWFFGQPRPTIRWMSAITVHEAITQIRRSKNTRWNIGSDGLDVLSADVRTPEQLAITQELAETLEAAQHLLPSKYCVVFRLREVESLSESETAAQLGITRSCVRIRVFRARVLLRDVLSDLDVERKRFPCSERTIVGAPAPT